MPENAHPPPPHTHTHTQAQLHKHLVTHVATNAHTQKKIHMKVQRRNSVHNQVYI